MAFLLNRKVASRIECLHSLAKFILAKHGENKQFSLKSVKFDSDDTNIHSYCSLVKDASLGIKYCPYKQNPLDLAGCALTNGVEVDSTKEKEVSNTINALHALGFVNRNDRVVTLTSDGVKFANAEYGTQEMQTIIENGVSNYGVCIGVLKQIITLMDYETKEFDSTKIVVGYPNTREKVRYNNINVLISSGSQKDSNVRTRSCILSWLTTAGFIRPKSLPKLKQGQFAHFQYRDFLNAEKRNDQSYVFEKLPNFCKDTKTQFFTNRPLDYNNLTKLTRALRENGMQDIREATLKFESKIQNRRFAILYLLNNAYIKKSALKFSSLVEFMQSNNNLFVITEKNLQQIIQAELEIADMAGIPFNITMENGDVFLKPLVGLNLNELTIGTPSDLINICKEFCDE